MNKDTFKGNYFLLHLIVFIWGWTAILGKAIELPALQLVWLRMPIALAGIFLFMILRRHNLVTDIKKLSIYFGLGMIVALHWICFYAAIKESNVSVTLACFSTGSLFSAFIEPFFFKRKVRVYEVVFGLMVVAALIMIFRVETQYTFGIILGILAALTSSVFGVFNGILMRNGHNGPLVSLYEMTGGFIGMSIYVLIARPWEGGLFTMTTQDFWLLLLLGLLCTSIPFLISLHILKTISPYTVSLTLNLETLYGIIFAYFIFHEDKQLTGTFYVGSAIILSTIFINGWIKMREKKKEAGASF
ncbi:MAG: DMT family transporter [Bacteroidia bacterium]|nr:DMT family transporter [Bacteroidia bacterium]